MKENIKKFENFEPFDEDDWDDEEIELDISNSKIIEKLTEWKGMGRSRNKTYYGLTLNFDPLYDNGKYLTDGIYDVTGLDYLMVDGLRFSIKNKRDELVKYILNHEENLHYANGYETETFIFFDGAPIELNGNNVEGSGFNYGSTNIISNCPEKIMILASND